MKLKELIKRLGKIKEELRSLSELDELSSEQAARFDELESESQEVRAKIKRAKAVDDLDSYLDDSDPADSVIGREDRVAAPVSSEPETASTDIVIPARARPLTRPEYYSRDSRQLQEDGYTAGQWILGTMCRNQRARQWCADHGIETRVMQGADSSLGGVLVPQQFLNAIIDLRERYGVFRRNTRVVSMSSDNMLVPRRAGGLTAYWVNETSSITASDATFSSVELTARKIGTLTRMSNDVSEDAVIDLADWLAQEIAWLFSKEEDEAGFIGTGASTYGGITGAAVKINDGNHAASIATADSGNTAFSTLDLVDFHRAVGKLPLYARMNARWYISAPGYADSMERLAYAGGGNTVDTISGGSGLSFLGYPVELSQVMNSTLTADVSAIKILFGDLRMASMLGDRRDLRVFTSEHRYVEFDQTAVVATQRFDINVHDLGDGTDAGPLVAIKTPAS